MQPEEAQSGGYDGESSSHIQWSWRTLAKEDGLVDVIIWFDPDRQNATMVESAIGEACRAWQTDGLQGKAASAQGITDRFEQSISGFSARMAPESIDGLISSTEGVEVYPDMILQTTFTASVGPIGADEMWTRQDPAGLLVTGAGIVIAVIDTGIDYTHPDLGGGLGPAYKVIGGYDFVNDDNDPMDDNGHGTHVAGVIAADGEMTGVAPDAKLIAYKVLGANGQGTMSDVIAGIDAAMDPNGDGSTSDHVDIISMSLGGPGQTSDPVCQAAERAMAAGVTVVVAAGNSGPSLGSVATPGLAPSVITVGAVNDLGVLAAFSSRGPTSDMAVKPEISAPGVDISSTVPYSGATSSSPTGYRTMSGTSMATPHVSGAVALLLQLHPDWSPSMLKSAIVSYSKDIGESLWTAGTGMIWLPEAADATLLCDNPLVSYGLAGSPPADISITNIGSSSFFTLTATDWLALYANGSKPVISYTSISGVSPASFTLNSGGSAQASISVPVPGSSEEGYYGGHVRISNGVAECKVFFGFVVLSTLTVHVIDANGNEVFDPYGGVWVYNLPDASVAMGVRGDIRPAPPATFFLPSATYSAHAIGHQLVYSYDDPYLLSSTVSLGRLQTLDVELRMADAHEMSVDLRTADGQPIYVKDFRMYCRYEGARNVSFDITGSDYSISGSEIFTIQDSLNVRVSDTAASVGVAVSGFAYSTPMWEFMSLNRNNWFEYASGSSTAFIVEASADLQYLLAWEFDGVYPATSDTLTWSEETCAGFLTKYDVPGTIQNPWSNWNTHRAIGGDAAFYVRKDTDTSLNPFFSGMTRTTYVQGVFSELYFPRSVVAGFSERQFFEADYDHLLAVASASGIHLPDRNFISPLPVGYEEQVLGMGPFYASVFAVVDDDAMRLFHPLLRDQSGAKVGAMFVPSMHLYKNGGLIGIFQLSEHQARPSAVRTVALSGAGTYLASIECAPSSQISTSVDIELGFVVPSTDSDPPRITGLEMPQRFVPGTNVPLTITAEDDSGSITADLSWRADASAVWQVLQVASEDGVFSAQIPTSADTEALDLMMTLTDEQGNFISVECQNAAVRQVPVVFELSPVNTNVPYRDAAVTIVLEGQLTDAVGNPLSTIAGVPLELMVDGEKIGMILDEYVVGTTHVHNGDIRFEWKLNPADLFSSVGESINVAVDFDLGVYEPVPITFTLTSVQDSALPPSISLNSPAQGSLFAPGETIDLDIHDDGLVTATVSVDGSAYEDLVAPWDIHTSEWEDGIHMVDVRATDNDGLVTEASYQFEVDGTPPVIEMVRPVDGRALPIGFEIQIEVTDAHLSSVSYSHDDALSVVLEEPYAVDLTGWDIGAHVVEFVAMDSLGHTATAEVEFEIVNSTVTAVIVSPSPGAVIQPGTPIDIDVYGVGAAECWWTEESIAHALTHPYDIDTTSWSEGAHSITVEVTDDLGGYFELEFEVVVDASAPVIVLISPGFGSYLTPASMITVHAEDDNLQAISWSVIGIVASSESATTTISVAFVTIEGFFSVTITAVDLAGNSAQETFAFVMDLSDPMVGIAGVDSGGAILPGTILTLSAMDTYLARFTWSLDHGTLTDASTPFDYSTEGLAAGWHLITMAAEDSAGRTTEEAISFYIDDSPPTATLEDEYQVESGDVLVINAVASDDFGIGGGVLCYESPGGGFSQLTMTAVGGELTAEIPPADLWDSMRIFIIVEDEAGNSFETDMAVVVVIPASSTPGEGVDDDDTETGSSFPMLTGALALGAGISGLIIIVLLSRRNKDEKTRSGGKPSPQVPSGSHLSAVSRPLTTGRRTVTDAAVRAANTKLARETMRIRDARSGQSDIGLAADGSVRAYEDARDPVEDRAVTIASRASVYSDERHPGAAIMDDDDEYGTPVVLSGLQLARDMRRDAMNSKKGAS